MNKQNQTMLQSKRDFWRGKIKNNQHFSLHIHIVKLDSNFIIICSINTTTIGYNPLGTRLKASIGIRTYWIYTTKKNIIHLFFLLLDDSFVRICLCFLLKAKLNSPKKYKKKKWKQNDETNQWGRNEIATTKSSNIFGVLTPHVCVWGVFHELYECFFHFSSLFTLFFFA